MNGNLLIEQLHWRYATKTFDPTKKVSAADWETLEKALVLTPSSFGLQPWKFIVIESADLKKKLTPFSWNQTQVADCSHYVVFTTRTSIDEPYIDSFIQDIAQTRGVPAESLAGYRKMMVGDLVQGGRSKIIPEWAARQAYIALGNLMTSAAILKIDTCPMEGIDPAKYDEVLGLTGTSYRTVVACAVGYRSAADKYQSAKKVRFGRSVMVDHR